MVGIVERGQGSPLGRRVDVEGLAHALHQADQLLRADAVTDAQTGQTVQLRKRSQGDDRAAVCMIAERVRVIGVGDIFKVGLIDD